MNVIQLDNYIPQQNTVIIESIERFLAFKRATNENTYTNYKSHITEFFRMTKNKGIEELITDDLLLTKKKSNSIN